MKTNLYLIPIFLSLSLSSTARADAWNAINDPALMDNAYEYHFAALPLEASLSVKPWSETYWATAKGSINNRWNTDYPDGFKYTPPTRAEVMTMSLEQKKQLSPAEKYDIYMGHYDYPLHEDAKAHSSSFAAWWKGICDGWTMAAIQFPEPQPIEVTNPDGVKVPFGSSDIKGLLSYYAQFHSGVDQVYVGGQCRGMGGFFGSAACDDINPGALQIILANQIGLKKKAFGIDRDPGKQIWNQPVFGYKTVVKGSASSKAASGILVETSLFYTDELEESSWDAVVGTPQFKSNVMEMEYVLDLDESGRIVGGKYSKGSTHPDLAWLPDGAIKFSGDFTQLQNLLQK